jgi:predicted aspartyl protease
VGTFKVRVKIWNIYEKLKEAEVELIVDGGSTYTVLPESLLKSLMVKPIRTIKLRLADSRIVEKAPGEVGIAVDGYSASATPVVFGEEEVYLLGAVTMEQLGLAPDPVKKKLVPVEALLLSFKYL